MTDDTTGTRGQLTALVSAVGSGNLSDGVRLAAVPALAATMTQDPFLVSVVSASLWGPWFIAGPLAGIYVDRLPRGRLLVSAHAVRALVAVALAGLVLTGRIGLVWLCALVILLGLGEVVADSAGQALVPTVAERSRLEGANARIITAEVGGNELAGPALGAALFALATGAPFVVASVLLAFAALAGLPLWPTPAPARAAATPVARSVKREFLEGWHEVVRTPLLRTLLLWSATVNLAVMIFEGVLVLVVTDTLGRSPSTYGLVLSLAALGSLGGVALAPRAVRRYGRRVVLIATSAVSGVTVLAMALADDVATLCVLLAVNGATYAFSNVVSRTIRQLAVPDALLGRVGSTYRAVAMGVVPIGALLGGAVARAAGLRATFGVAGTIVLVATLALVRPTRDPLMEVGRAS